MLGQCCVPRERGRSMLLVGMQGRVGRGCSDLGAGGLHQGPWLDLGGVSWGADGGEEAGHQPSCYSEPSATHGLVWSPGVCLCAFQGECLFETRGSGFLLMVEF